MKDIIKSEGWVKVLTAEEIEQLMLDGSNNPYSPMPTPIGKGFDGPKIICSDCKGTGEYKGLFVTEDCQKCGGKGTCMIS